ncbi:hypothetical protein [Nostoc sp. UHCC 0870]|nr:hypothetical protein [Nostoc sp. UHCC 0870]
MSCTIRKKSDRLRWVATHRTSDNSGDRFLFLGVKLGDVCNR